MKQKTNVRILSRKSELAIIQARLVGLELKKKFPDLNISYLYKSTKGDIDQTSPLSNMKSLGVFTNDLRKDLQNNKCDIIVHSWKDLPIEFGDKTFIAGTLKRADERDILFIVVLQNKNDLKQQSTQQHRASSKRTERCTPHP